MITGGIFGKKKYNWGDPQAPVEGMPPMGTGVGMPGLGAMQQPEQPKKPGFFKSDAGRQAIGTFADTLIRLRSGVNPGIVDNMRRGQDRQFAEAQYERKRTDDYADFVKQQQFKQQNPEPSALDRNANWMLTATPEQKQAAAEYYDMTVPKLVTGADGRAIPVRRSSGPQPGAVVDGFRFKGGDPNNRESWEPVGGGSGNAAGNFPR